MSDPRDPIRVLVAEDHALVREGTRELLSRDARIRIVGEATDGLEAMEMVEALRPHVALVDIAMPGANGLEVTRHVKASRPEVAVLVLTVHDEAPYVVALLEAGAAGYLLKDVGGEELVAAIHAVHAGEAVLHPTLTRTVLDQFARGGSPPAPHMSDLLTDRECEVLELAGRGLSNKQIAVRLELSPRTVQTHLGNVFQKLNVASRTEAVIQALQRGWLDIEELT